MKDRPTDNPYVKFTKSESFNSMEFLIDPDQMNMARLMGESIRTAEFMEEAEALFQIARMATLNQDIDTDAISVLSNNNRCNEEKGKTMANIIKKKDLLFTDGYITLKDGTIISPSFVEKYNELERLLQKAQHANELKKLQDIPRFHQQSNFSANLIEVPEVETPVMDANAKTADELGKELRLLEAREEVLATLEHFNTVVEFVAGPTIVVYDVDYHATLIDTPMLGNPLKLTTDKLLKLVCEAAEYQLD